MKIFLASALLTGFGSGFFNIEEPATNIDYQQNSTSTTVTGTDFLGGTLGGYFSVSQDWQSVGKIGLRASVAGTNPNSYFLVEFYSGPSLDLVGVYEGTTESLPASGSLKDIELSLILQGSGNVSDIRGMQFTWAGEGYPINFSMHSLVDMSKANPQITSYKLEPAGFSIKWTGTGNVPVDVQRSTNLSTGVWLTIATGVTVREYLDTSTPAGRAFYRVVVP